MAYAKERGVGIRLWVHWKPLSKHLEEAFTLYEEWGVKGLMVDFLDRDDQEMIEWTEQMLEVRRTTSSAYSDSRLLEIQRRTAHLSQPLQSRGSTQPGVRQMEQTLHSRSTT